MITRAAVIGAGITALIANAGIKVDLLDIVPAEVTPEEQKKD